MIKRDRMATAQMKDIDIKEKRDIIKLFDLKIQELMSQYKQTNQPVKFDFRKFCSKWKWTKRSDVYTHYLHKYPAKLIPYIPVFFFSSSMCGKSEIVMDPFMGSGTVLLEAITNPIYKRNCIGIDINPLARLIAKVKTTTLDENMLKEKKQKLYDMLNNNNLKPVTPDYNNLSLWFSNNAQKKLGVLKACIDRFEKDIYKDFFSICFSSLIRKVALADPNIPPPVILRLKKYKKSKQKYKFLKEFLENNKKPNVKRLFKEIVKKNENRVKKLNGIEEISTGKIKAQIIWDDSRTLMKGKIKSMGDIEKRGAKKIKNGSIGLIISSPPYITAQKYIRTTKLEMLWLGMANSNDLVQLDRDIIGSEKVRSSEKVIPLGVNEIDDLCKKIATISKERAIMISKYLFNMRLVMQHAYRVLKKGGE